MKLNVIAAGGAGISISDKVVNKIAELGSGFATVEKYFIDSSINNIDKIEHDSNRFYKIKSTQVGAGEIAGAGGNRTNNVQDVMVGVNEFLNKFKFTKPVTGEYVVVIFSGSGGSGSNIGSLLLKELMNRDIPAVAIMVGDSSSGEACVNTIGVLSGLDNIAKSIGKSVSLFYVNNNSMNKKQAKKESDLAISQGEKEDRANEQIFHFMVGLSLFTSGVNESLDYSDVKTLLCPHNIKTFKSNLAPGVYNICLTNDLNNLPDGFDVMLARSLTAEGENDVSLGDNILLSHKAGKVVDENAIESCKGRLPIFLASTVNYLNKEVDNLNTIAANMVNIAKGIENKTITSSVGDHDSESGLVF